MQQMDRDRDKNGSSNARPPSLLDKQLEDILRTAERTHRRRLFWQRLRSTGRNLFAWRRGRRVSSGRLMAIGLALCLLAGFLGRGAPALLSSALVLLGAILFLSPIVLNYGRRGSAGGRQERLWRGRVVEYEDQRWRTTQAWIGRMLRRFRGGGPPGGRR